MELERRSIVCCIDIYCANWGIKREEASCECEDFDAHRVQIEIAERSYYQE